jgi:hypothetical protein
MFKGIQKFDALQGATEQCTRAPADGLVYVETDMRVPMNPSRQEVLREVARDLGARLRPLSLGWGLVEMVKDLPCEWCGTGTDRTLREIHRCPWCGHRVWYGRSDGLRLADPGHCSQCNP